MPFMMKNTIHKKKMAIPLLVLACILVTALTASAGLRDQVVLTSTGVTVAGEESSTFLQLRVVGPDGLVVGDLTSDGGALTWTLSENNDDGLYSYEAIAGSEGTKSPDEVDNNLRGLGVKKQPDMASGSFNVKDGAIVLQTREEASLLNRFLDWGHYAVRVLADFVAPPVYADVVHADDVIIQFSLCAGTDCINGENFGFDTLRLKENNLQIHFDDTSASASFPANDWRIVINDTDNGGSNYFAVEDSTAGRKIFTVEAGAPANSLYVEDDGDVGIGTSAPAVNLHVVDGNTPTLRLEQNGSSGFTAQTWDVASNEANFFVRDVTNGSRLPFKIIPGAPDNALYIAADGDIGLGVTSPGAALDVRVAAHVDGNAEETALRVSTSSDSLFTVSDAGNAYLLGNLEIGSSRSLKENISFVKTDEAMEALGQLQPVHFNYRHSPGIPSLGFIAEDVPELVAVSDRKAIRPMDIVTVLTKVTQEQQREIASLQETVSVLQDKLNAGGNKEVTAFQ